MREESNAIFFENSELLSSTLWSTAFPEEPDKNHVTVGLGLAKDKDQLDLAVDHTLDGGTTLILSMIHYY